MTWNIEGLKRNIFNLKELLSRETPDFIFLSESQIFSSDVVKAMIFLQGEYSFHSNSEDCFDHDLPLIKMRASGGTLTLWRHDLNPFVTVHLRPLLLSYQ